MNLVQYKSITYEGQPYPAWAEALGWLITLASIIWVPCVATYKIITTEGSLLQVYLIIFFALLPRVGKPI
jgi:hypothetical protein